MKREAGSGYGPDGPSGSPQTLSDSTAATKEAGKPSQETDELKREISALMGVGGEHDPPWRGLFLSLLLGFLQTGCDQATQVGHEWTVPADSSAVLPLTFSPSLCTDCLTLQPITVFGDKNGDGFLMLDERVVRDSVGNYWAGNGGWIKVFSPDGSFLRDVGRSGEGPLEFSRARPVYTDSSGNVHILDTGNLRETVVGPDFLLSSERGLPRHFNAWAPLSDGKRYVVNTWLQRTGQSSNVLHIIDGDEVLYSFCDVGVGFEGPASMMLSERVLAVDGEERVLSASRYALEIEAWTETGGRIVGFSGPVLNDELPGTGPPSAENPLPSQIMDIHVDQDGLLWVAIFEPVDDWLHLVLAGTPDPMELYRSRLDVIDLDGGTIVASQIEEELLWQFLDNGDLVEGRFLEDGTPQFVIHRPSYGSEPND
jgi:hypothetical protein